MNKIILLTTSLLFFINCSATKEQTENGSDSTLTNELLVKDQNPRIPSNSTFEDGWYRIKPTIDGSFEYNPEQEKEYKRIEELQKKIDKGELKFDSLPETEQMNLDELSQVGGYWSVGVSPVPQWFEEFPPRKIWATSTLAPSKNVNYEIGNLIDYDLRTVWSEGATGNGIGESLNFDYPGKNEYQNETSLTSVTILNGFVKSNDLWRKNGRVKTFKLYINDKPFALLELEDSKAYQTFDLGRISSANGFILKFEIFEVYLGDTYEDVVVSHFKFDGDGILCFDGSTEIEMTNGIRKRIDQIRAGDEIVTFDIMSGKISKSIVELIGQAIHNNLVEIRVGAKQIIATSDHPFLTRDQKWVSASSSSITGVAKLIPGMEILTIENGTIQWQKVTSIEVMHKNQITYAITKTSTNQPYLANGMLVAIEPILAY